MEDEVKPLLHAQTSSASFSSREPGKEYGINDDGRPEKRKVAREDFDSITNDASKKVSSEITEQKPNSHKVVKSFYNQTYYDRYGEDIDKTLLTLLWAITVSFFCIGGMFGGVLAPAFAGKYGRKRTLLLNNLIALTSAALQGFAKSAGSFEMLIAGRIIAGVCCAMRWLRNSDDIAEDFDAITTERNEHRNAPKMKVGDLIRNHELRWPLIICIVLQMSQQFSGINAVIYYSTSIFKSAGLSHEASEYATLGTGLVNVMMTFVSALIMDRAGRRTLHMTGLGGMFVFSVLLVICLSLQSSAGWLSYISIVAVIVYIIFFATGPGAIPWFMVAEMFAQGPRTAAVSVSVVVNWLCNFLVGICYPILQKAITTYSFMPFCVMLVLFFIFTYLFVPETKGKTITEITNLFKQQTTGSDTSRSGYFSPAVAQYEVQVDEPSEADNSVQPRNV
ncbi:solute carrier family 2, facilitated glucose transporter member 1 [Elysia marginata]|uniref:Solute carrier family 2, facilitated glucose transporter member 1 n=1 Tax=Elysia marginata TaxID=1093978 RepID=A0AAV4I427_9GAST|nr:solute carrier family 2, facilitated glucose transporter member 1 [Elysia marginata]